ncbi:MAG TPA: hypothetical protein VGL57_15445 [Solirubrobacteraceae bacterium]|jgi:hypothetical protein
MASPEAQIDVPGNSAGWALQPGEVVLRTLLHQRYGGSKQGGIAPSRTSPNVMIFSEAASGEQHGYFDGWRDDGRFHYTGEGQRGDQQMKGGNAAILRHRTAGRALRLFDGARARVTYEGEFELDPEQSYYTTDAPETKTDQTRSVIVFRLRPLDRPPQSSNSPLDRVNRPGVERVRIERQFTEKAFVEPNRKEYEAERREQRLVLAFQTYLEGLGHDVDRLKIVPGGEAKPLFSDLMDWTTNTLYEAKGTVERGAVRMAIGQLLDYSRFVEPPPTMAVLLPSEPRSDLRELLSFAGVGLVCREGEGFVSVGGGLGGAL